MNLFFKKKSLNNLEFTGFKDILEVKHRLKNRVRLYSPFLYKRLDILQFSSKELSKIESIRKIQFSEISGTILIEFNENELDFYTLFSSTIRILGLQEEVEKPRVPKVKRAVKDLTECLNHSIYQKTKGFLDFKTLIPITFLYFAVKGFYNSVPSKPNPYSLLYWSYRNLFCGL